MENQPKKLLRTKKDKVIAGVCAGFAKYFNLDPILVRAAFILLGLINGAGIILYIILMIIIPEETEDKEKEKTTEQKIEQATETLKQSAHELAEKMKEKRPWIQEKRNIIGLIIVAVGIIALINIVLPLHWLNWKILWAAGLIIVGLYIIFKK